MLHLKALDLQICCTREVQLYRIHGDIRAEERKEKTERAEGTCWQNSGGENGMVSMVKECPKNNFVWALMNISTSWETTATADQSS